MSTFKVEVVSIDDVEKHPNADRLDLIAVKGWRVVAAIGQYKKGDTTIYVPIDSILPKELEDHLFPIDSAIKLSKSRVKSIKIRKAVSQGMCINIDGILHLYPKLKGAKVGDDVTAILGITKYEPPAHSVPGHMQAKSAKNGNNPYFHKYTDIENFKNHNRTFEEGEQVYVTEKLHGTSARFGKLKAVPTRWWQKVLSFLRVLPEHEFVYGSRNVQLQNRVFKKLYYGKDVYAKIAQQLNLENVLQPGEALYGEIVGHGIQGGYNYGCAEDEHKFFAYDVKVDGEYLPSEKFIQFCDSRGIARVPVLHIGEFNAAHMDKLRQGDSTIKGQKVREGVVIKSLQEDNDKMIGRKVLKYINDEYLLRDNTDFH